MVEQFAARDVRIDGWGGSTHRRATHLPTGITVEGNAGRETLMRELCALVTEHYAGLSRAQEAKD